MFNFLESKSASVLDGLKVTSGRFKRLQFFPLLWTIANRGDPDRMTRAFYKGLQYFLRINQSSEK